MDRSVLRGTALILIALAAIIALVLMPGAKAKKQTAAENLDPWVMVSNTPDAKYGTYLGNGYISTRIMGDGVGSQDGKPLQCFMAGLYDDEKLVPTPTWSDLRFYDGKEQFKIDKDADYKQSLNMKTGILTTEATWRAGNKSLKGSIEVIVSRAQPNVGLVKADFVSDYDGEISVEAPIRITSDRLQMINEHGKSQTTNYITKESKINLSLATCILDDTESEYKRGAVDDRKYAVIVKNGKRNIVSVYSALASGSDADATAKTALNAAVSSCNSGDAFITDHKNAWAKLWEKDIVIDGSKKDQQAIHSCMFYLLESVREGSQWSIPPMGLSDTAFSGHVFWDADLWMFPALILQHPELARSIVDYRYNTLPGAMANAKSEGFSGAQYAWESGYTGKEDTPPGLVYRNERHITGDVALAQWQYYLATGDLNWLKTRGYTVIKATADYWASRAKFNSKLNRYEILQVVPPDENAELVNNSAYTNCLAKQNLQIAIEAAKLAGIAPNPKWAEVAQKIYEPYDQKNKRFIAFDNYKGLKAKQADTELLIYPIQYKIPNQTMTNIYKNTFDFYAPKVMPNGPAMISSVHSVIAARLGMNDKSYAEFNKSYEQYLRGPFNYFNEKRSEFYVNMCFLTGAAGPIQATLFGITGINMDYFPANSQAEQLKFTPCMPHQWKSLKITGIQWRGQSFDLTVSKDDKTNIVKKTAL